jgi:fucose 4-O-acetylase-like acetyltransferase
VNIDREISGTHPQRDVRFDFVKAISICFVFVWHVNPIRSDIPVLKFLLSLFYQNLSLIAVPTFITVSLMLFVVKVKKGGFQYLRKRVTRLLNIFIFWVSMQYCLSYLVQKEVPSFTPKMIFYGGPAILIAGASVFYFLSDLIILTIALYVFLHLSDNVKKYVSVIIAILTLLYFAASSTIGFRLPAPIGLGPYNYLLSFIIYIPLSYYLRINMEFAVRHKYAIAVMLVLLVTYEKIMRVIFDLNLFAPYSRISVIAGMLLLITIAFSIKTMKAKRYIITLSKYSLGIFGVHTYFKLLSYNIFDYVNSIIIFPITFILAVIFTYLFIYMTKNSFLKNYIS